MSCGRRVTPMPDPTRAKLAADDAVDVLHRFAVQADDERRQLLAAVKAIGAALTDPAYDADPALKVDLALRLVNRTVKAWEAGRDV